MASFEFKRKPIPEMFLGVDDITPEYECTPCGNRLRGIWVYIGGTAHYFGCDQYTICNPVEATEDGRRQAFDLVRKIYDMAGSERREAFDKAMLGEIIRDADYDELTKKLDNWKKEKETIRVRDEVVNVNNGCKMVITLPPQMSSDSVMYMSGIAKSGRVYKNVEASLYKKTGVHVNNLDEYLEV